MYGVPSSSSILPCWLEINANADSARMTATPGMHGARESGRGQHHGIAPLEDSKPRFENG